MSRLRWMTAGESHGPRLVAMARGHGRGGRMKIETDRVELGGGVCGYRAPQIEAF